MIGVRGPGQWNHADLKRESEDDLGNGSTVACRDLGKFRRGQCFPVGGQQRESLVDQSVAGAEFPDEWIILGNHHDAWTYGAVDPNSGTTALLEVARGLEALRETGWRTRRKLKLAFWGAEEYGKIGSTEWVEQHRDELREKAVTYINLDAFTAGPFAAAGSL